MLTIIQNLPDHVFGVRATVTDIFNFVSPGEAKGYELSELQAAIDCSTSNPIQKSHT